MVNLSPNMVLPVPAVGLDPGPQYATNLNACLTLLDAHNHSAGYGVPITPDGLNINGNLPLNQNNLTLAKSVRFTPQSIVLNTPADIGCVYVLNNDLYYNDIAGNVVRITQGGGIAGSPGTIANLTSPASASYIAANQTFVFQSDANKAANMDFGSATLRNLTTSSAGVKIAPPVGLASDYTMTLPAGTPASTKIVTMDASGALGAAYDTDNVSLEVASNLLRVKYATLAISSSSGNFGTPSTTYVDVPNLSITFTASGRAPVFIGLVSDGTATGPATVGFINSGGTGNCRAQYRILRSGTEIGNYVVSQVTAATTQLTQYIPSSCIHTYDTPSAGTYTYKIQLLIAYSGGTALATCDLSKLIVREMY